MKGFQLFYEAFKPQLLSKLDAVVAVVHFMLVNDDFLCVGVGDQFTEADANAGSEELPSGWNANNQVYSLKYRSRNDNLKLLLKGIVVGDHFIVSAVPLNSSETVHSVSIKADQFVTSDWKGHYSKAFVSGDVKPLADLLQKEVFTKLRVTPASAKGKDQQQKSNDEDPGKSSLLEKIYVPPRPGAAAGPQPYGDPNIHPQFPRIGTGDLDPFNRGGPGMLYDPFSRQPGNQPSLPSRDPMFGHLPPGAVPPGARFDPTGPPLPPNFPKGGKSGGFPPPDHFPPPGGYDPYL